MASASRHKMRVDPDVLASSHQQKWLFDTIRKADVGDEQRKIVTVRRREAVNSPGVERASCMLIQAGT
jgi:hypothetical protein